MTSTLTQGFSDTAHVKVSRMFSDELLDPVSVRSSWRESHLSAQESVGVTSRACVVPVTMVTQPSPTHCVFSEELSDFRAAPV